jgi:hypothetical protein
MVQWRRATAASLGLLLAAAVSSCGNDDKGLSKAEFVKQANQLCEEADSTGTAAFESVTFKNPMKPGNEELQQLAGKLLPSLREHRADLAALGAPEGRKDDFDALLAAVDQTISKVKGAAENSAQAADLADPDYFQAITKAQNTLGICPEKPE